MDLRDERNGLRRGVGRLVGGVGLAAALVAAACTTGGGGSTTSSPEPVDRPVATIAQPAVPGDLPVAPESTRVDVAMPTFSDPTRVTNPLFPVSDQRSVLLLGRVDGEPFRTEVTLLPDTRIIEWQGQPVETLVSQYVAYLDGRIHEVAYDFYAQADDGSVWYFGEDVFNFLDGVIVDTHGTWIAGKDGPAAMIMPAHPRVGDVYRPENIPGFVFEEVTVRSVDETLDGPLGPVAGGLLVEELHMDGGTESKSFAPGYGEFYTAGGGDVEALALAVPTDGASGPVPAELERLLTGALSIHEAATSGRWSAAASTAGQTAAAWDAYRTIGVPVMIEPRVSRSLGELAAAVDRRDETAARQASIDVARWALDLELRYRDPLEIDLARFDLWAAQLVLDAGSGDAATVNGDLFALDYVRDRILHALDGDALTSMNLLLEELRVAVDDSDLPAAADVAERLGASVVGG